MSVFGLAKSQPAEPAQKGHVLVWPPEHFTVVYTLCSGVTVVEVGIISLADESCFLKKDI